MPAIVRNNGQSFFITTVLIPSDLHEQARALGISLSGTLREALAEKIDAEGSL